MAEFLDKSLIYRSETWVCPPVVSAYRVTGAIDSVCTFSTFSLFPKRVLGEAGVWKMSFIIPLR